MKRWKPRDWMPSVAVILAILAILLLGSPWLLASGTAGKGQVATAVPLVEGLLPSPEATAIPTATSELVPVPSSVLVDAAADYGILLTPPPEPTPTAVDQWVLEVASPPWPVDCTDEVAWNGYIVPDFDDYCVPGILSRHTLNIQFPRDFYGVLSSYGPYAMELMEDRAGVRRGHGIALTTCGMMGYTVWLRLPGDPWRGPFTVVDCGAQAHTFYQIAVQGLAVEVGYTVGQTWTPASSRVDVRIGSYPGPDWDGLYLAHWWVDNALQWETGYPLLQHLITRTDGTTYLWPPLE